MFESQITINDKKISANTPSCIITTDTKGAIIGVSGNLQDLTGFGINELAGMACTALFHGDMPANIIIQWNEKISQGRKWRAVIKWRTKGGNHFFSDVCIFPRVSGSTVSGAYVVLSKSHPSVEKRAGRFYRTRRKISQSDNKPDAKKILQARGGLTLLPTLIAITLTLIILSVWHTNWLSLASCLLLGVLGIIAGRPLGRREFAEQAGPIIDDPLMCYLFTGGVDEFSRVRYAVSVHNAERRAFNACVSQYGKHRLQQKLLHKSLVIPTHFAINGDSTFQSLQQAMHSLLADQHQASGAATRIMQLIFELQQHVLDERTRIDRLMKTSRHQRHCLEHARHLSQDLLRCVNHLTHANDLTNDSLPVVNPSPSNMTNSFEPVTKALTHASKVQAATASSDHTNKKLQNAARAISITLETGIQATRDNMLVARGIDTTLQTMLSAMLGINSLAVSVENAMHHQSVTRSTTQDHLDTLQGNMAQTVQAGQNASANAEQLEQHLTELQSLVSNFIQAIEPTHT